MHDEMWGIMRIALLMRDKGGFFSSDRHGGVSVVWFEAPVHFFSLHFSCIMRDCVELY